MRTMLATSCPAAHRSFSMYFFSHTPHTSFSGCGLWYIRYPKTSANGKKANKPLAGGFKGILWSLIGDLEYMNQKLDLPHFATQAGNCALCKCTGGELDTSWKDCRTTAAWLNLFWSREEHLGHQIFVCKKRCFVLIGGVPFLVFCVLKACSCTLWFWYHMFATEVDGLGRQIILSLV